MSKITVPTITHPQHTLPQSFLLHLLLGVLVTFSFLLFKPLLDTLGYPPLFAFLLAILFVDLPVLLGIMLFVGKQINGKLSLNGVVFYREKMGKRPFALIFIGAFVLLFLLISLIIPVNNYLAETLFSGLPSWLFLDEQSQYLAYPKNILVVTFLFQLVLTGIILPWVEELYFRGFLLPRLDRYNWLTLIISGLGFGLYHSWQPFGFLTVFLLGAALGYLMMWRQDIRLPIGLHIFANLLARLGFLMAALAL